MSPGFAGSLPGKHLDPRHFRAPTVHGSCRPSQRPCPLKSAANGCCPQPPPGTRGHSRAFPIWPRSCEDICWVSRFLSVEPKILWMKWVEDGSSTSKGDNLTSKKVYVHHIFWNKTQFDATQANVPMGTMKAGCFKPSVHPKMKPTSN